MLEEFPETQINIDLKDQEERLIARVGEVLKTHGAENRLATEYLLLVLNLQKSLVS